MNAPVDETARRRRHRNERIFATIGVLVLLTAVFAFHRWNTREEEMFERDRTYIPTPVQMTPEIQLLQQYVRIDTSNPPGNEIAGARLLASVLEHNGVPFEIIESAPGRASLYARIRGKRAGEGLLLLNHIDVIPADPKGWSKPPFGGEVVLSTLYGRGTLDMKAVAVCQLAAFIDVARSGRQPERDVVFLAVADEETGGALGLGWLIRNRPELFEGIGYALGEGGITEMVADKLTYFAIEVGAKQYATFTLESPNREALDQARWILQPYFTSSEPHRILPEVRQYFRDIAPTRVAFRDKLSDIDGAVARGDFFDLSKAYRDLTQTSITMHWPRRTASGWEAKVYLLMLPDEVPQERAGWLRELVEPAGARLRVDSIEPPTPLSSSRTPLFDIVAQESAREYSVRSGTLVQHQSTTDLRYLRRLGITSYGLSPFPVDAFQSATIHGVNEQIRLDRFGHGVALMRRVVRRWAFGE